MPDALEGPLDPCPCGSLRGSHSVIVHQQVSDLEAELRHAVAERDEWRTTAECAIAAIDRIHATVKEMSRG